MARDGLMLRRHVSLPKASAAVSIRVSIKRVMAQAVRAWMDACASNNTHASRSVGMARRYSSSVVGWLVRARPSIHPPITHRQPKTHMQGDALPGGRVGAGGHLLPAVVRGGREGAAPGPRRGAIFGLRPRVLPPPPRLPPVRLRECLEGGKKGWTTRTSEAAGFLPICSTLHHNTASSDPTGNAGSPAPMCPCRRPPSPGR